MPDPDRPQAVLPLVQRYHRRERLLSALVALLVVGLIVTSYLASSFLTAILFGLALTVLLGLPLFRFRGSARLRTDESPETVAEEWTGSTPPALVFQWGLADAITRTETQTVYELSDLFGLRSVEMRVETDHETTPEGADRIELAVTASDQPWATYTIRIEGAAEQTIVDVEYSSGRRFDLRALPQKLLSDRYYEDGLAALGYTVVERETSFGR
jgi:hypothetical protein